MMKLTAFGREVRRLRDERDESLRTMAKAIGTSPAFLSGVETGSKNLPDDLFERICNYLSLTKDGKKALKELAAQSVRTMKVAMRHGDDEAREIAVAFARRFPQLSEAEKELLREVLLKPKK